MIRLRREGVEAPADWREAVDAAFPDAAAFWKKAKAFEKLTEQGATRKKGFTRYAPDVLPSNRKGKRDLPPVWRTEACVRAAIAGMSRGICAYCQSPVSSTHPGKRGKDRPPGQVDHFRPKARFPAQAYDWNNYFLACMACNIAKGDMWPSGGYVRPDEGEPGSRFVFARSGAIRARKGDEQAKRTIEDLELRRYWLTWHRGKAIERHLKIVVPLMGRPGFPLEMLLIDGPDEFSEAINQNVRRVWANGRRKRKPSRARPRRA
ncbi:HNH endonuclease [Sorangium sp. So ce375]|uniref:HNH endonuclease n=1 Tax=Sorangium sp. So ce375 TaxID=3133306 RepID=UPI003F5B9B43